MGNYALHGVLAGGTKLHGFCEISGIPTQTSLLLRGVRSLQTSSHLVPILYSVWVSLEGDALEVRLFLGKAGSIPAVALLHSLQSFPLLAASGMDSDPVGIKMQV